MPYYLDLGSGESKLTLQILGGMGYAFNWGDVTTVWRYLDYNYKSSTPTQNVSMSGPQIALVFHW